MSTQAQRLLRIEHKDGRRYAVTESAYLHTKLAGLGNQTYQDAGFEVVSYEDGTAYETGNEPTGYALVGAYGSPAIGTVTEAKETPSPRRTTAAAAIAAPEAEPQAETAP